MACPPRILAVVGGLIRVVMGAYRHSNSEPERSLPRSDTYRSGSRRNAVNANLALPVQCIQVFFDSPPGHLEVLQVDLDPDAVPPGFDRRGCGRPRATKRVQD